MEFCPYGQLYEILRDGKEIIPGLVVDWTKQITSGMHYLHTQKLIHRYLGRKGFITKKINNSIDFLRHAHETRFSNFRWESLGKLRHFSGRTSPETRLIPKVN